jgi:peroxiredoxin (alkyl hydroperoxide reductase subunit C)
MELPNKFSGRQISKFKLTIKNIMYQVDQPFPEFVLEAYFPKEDKVKKISLKSFPRKFLILFFYPADFTFVCPTELADMQRRYKEFQKIGAEIVGVSTDTVFTHKAWLQTEGLLSGIKYPLAADHNGYLSRLLGIYDEESGMAQRAAFIIDPKGILRAVEIVADNIGRSAGEILRKTKALKYVYLHHGKACPASWDEGGFVLSPSIKIAGKVKQALSGPKKKGK